MSAGGEPSTVTGLDRTESMDTVRERRFRSEYRVHRVQVAVDDLQHGTRLLAEQRRDGVGAERVQVDVETRAARERHLEHARSETAVGAVVVRRGPPFMPQSGENPE